MEPTVWSLLGIFAAGVEILGIFTAAHAVMGVRTAQGAIAWALSLVMFPYIALPLYWILCQNKFEGYVDARRTGDLDIHHIVQDANRRTREQGLFLKDGTPTRRVFEVLAEVAFTHSNLVELLVDGEVAFGEIFRRIDTAKEYILVQFFIVRDDQLGRELKTRLMRKAREGVRVMFLYDEIGSRSVRRSRTFQRDLTAAGVSIRPFGSNRRWRNPFQINFRNHRKIVVVDGRVAYVGGLNVGDEYIGRDPNFGPWRDTHVRLEGPAVQAVQLSFLEDWYWAAQETPPLDWTPRPVSADGQNALVLPTGPADELETCGLFFVQMINAAQQRLWITSPYFVPDPQVMCALQLASLRGVDVRIMLPQHPDHLLVYLSSFSYLKEAEQADVKIYRYQPGFMHHKVILVDDHLAAVGTANLDNRSFRLNFEITVLVEDRKFAAQVEAMLRRDFEQCERAHAEDLLRRSFWFRVAVRVARLMSPVQ
jgi:cardiolipin synthase A/B